MHPRRKLTVFTTEVPKKIIETIHVDFDELTAIVSEQSSLEPALHEMTPVTPSSGLAPNHPPSAPFVPPSRHEWDLVFQPVFDEFFSPLASVASLVPVEEAPAHVESTSSPFSTIVDQDALIVVLPKAKLNPTEIKANSTNLEVSTGSAKSTSVDDQEEDGLKHKIEATNGNNATKVTIAFNDFGEKLVQRMHGCQRGNRAATGISLGKMKEVLGDCLMAENIDLSLRLKLEQHTGTDTRPPMLVENDYESWKIRIHRSLHLLVLQLCPHRWKKKLDSEFNDEENKLEMADTQAEIILSQGLPRHIFNILNQTSTAQEIWNNVELLMQGSGRTLQQRKEDLFDEYERFRAIGNESIHDYFVRFHKLVNDMKITQLEIPTHQMNTKFVNNLPAYWGKYVTNVKQNMDISTTPYVQIYTHLKAYEPHAKKTLKKQEQSTSIVDPLAYVAHTTSAPALSSPSTPSPQPTAQSPNDALMATMTQIANLLSGFQKQFPPTNNQLRTSSNSRTHATVHDGHIVTEPVQRKAPGNVGNTGARGKKVICYNCRGEGHVARQCKEPKRKMDSQYFKDKALLMEAKEKGDVLDAEAEAFLADVECTAPYDQPQALTTTNMFQANHEDAYDSDVDEGPNAAVAFMANLSSTSATNNPVNEVHSNDNQIFDNVDYQLSQEMHQEEHLDSDAETEIDDNTIPYHQYLLDTEAQNVPTEVSADTFDKVSMIAILTDLQTQLDGHAKVNQEKCLEIETLKNELLQCKQEINITPRYPKGQTRS
ncbi:retrovirus-related pol polyprotein from transposon TNT 1-94 [Tanacetum coccineum]